MSEEMTRCPLCEEEILAVAKKCKHCGSSLEDGANCQFPRPSSESLI